MNIPLKPADTAETSRETYYKTNDRLEATALDIPEAARELAEKNGDQTREAYERSKMLSKQHWTLWRGLSIHWAKVQRHETAKSSRSPTGM